nr:apolipoprotein N-acyltransferase [Corynebacterium aquatimens]
MVLAALGGITIYFSHEPHGFFIAGIVGIALFYAALSPWGHRAGAAAQWPSARAGALIGFVHAVAVYLPLLPWVGEFVGALPWIALSIACAMYSMVTGLFGVLVARWRYGYLAFPFVYVAVEAALSSFPYGGFSWVRLAWGQINGPLASLAAWGGPALVTFGVVVAGAGVASAIVAVAQRRAQNASLRPAGIALGAALIPVVVGMVGQYGVYRDGPTTDEVTVAAIQGNVPRMGLDFNAQRRAVLANHVNETTKLADELKQTGGQVDLVFWPENASDVNPFADPEAYAAITKAVTEVGAPTLVGTLTEDEVGDRNTAVVFDPATGPGDRHNKKFLQPFGEWMPMRDFFRKFSSYVDMAGDFKPGTGNGTVRMGDVVVGVATCYEVAFDPAYREAVKNGAQILTTPTNNATFGFTDMTYQQLAMSRMRAIETDRAVVVAATSGASAIVYPDGKVSKISEIFTPAHLVDTLPLRDSVTFAVRYGRYVQWLLVLVGLAVMAAALYASRRGYADGEKSADAEPKSY